MIAETRLPNSGTQKLVSVIIVNYNGKHFLGQCLQSLSNQIFQNFEALLVDNGSSDDSVPFVRRFFPWVRVIKSETNLGYAAGNNLGVKFARGDLIVLLNNDTIVATRWLAELVKAALEGDTVGVVGSKLLFAHDKRVIDALGFACDQFAFPRPIARNTVNNDQYIGIHKVFAVPGCSMLIKRELIDSLGLFDPDYFMLSEDIDFCWRVNLAGYSCVVNCSSIVYHVSMGTTKTVPRPRIKYLSERNTLRSLIKNYSFRALLRVLPRYFAILVSEVFALVRIKHPRLAFADLRAVAWNIANFRKTWQFHNEVQSKRKLTDKEVQRMMSHFSYKISRYRELIRFIQSTKK